LNVYLSGSAVGALLNAEAAGLQQSTSLQVVIGFGSCSVVLFQFLDGSLFVLNLEDVLGVPFGSFIKE
jgi:hypothetical protein